MAWGLFGWQVARVGEEGIGGSWQEWFTMEARFGVWGRGVWEYGRNRAALWSLIVTIHDLERHELPAMRHILDFTHSCGRQRFGDIV